MMENQDHQITGHVRPGFILDNIPEALFTIDKEFRITFFNQKAEQITGFSREEAMGRPCSEIFKPEICSSSCYLRASLSTGIPCFDQQVQIFTKDDEPRWISVRTSPLKDAAGEVIGGVETFLQIEPEEKEQEKPGVIYHMSRRLGRDKAIKKILKILPDIAQSDAPVLILGENGVGKDLVASAIHRLSKRSRAGLITVDCSAFSEMDLMDKLFGYQRNGLPRGNEDRIGALQGARGGTLFLHALDSLPMSIQTMLYKALESGRFELMADGGTLPLNVRFIGATEVSLEERVRAGIFKESLYYWWRVFQIDLPPLRHRKEDILFLANEQLCRLNQKGKKVVEDFDFDALHALQRHDYPGNLKELENIVHHAYIMAKEKEICLTDLPARLIREKAGQGDLPKPDGNTIEEAKQKLILGALRRTNWQMKKAAEQLGIDRTTLWRNMKRMGWGSRIRPALTPLHPSRANSEED